MDLLSFPFPWTLAGHACLTEPDKIRMDHPYQVIRSAVLRSVFLFAATFSLCVLLLHFINYRNVIMISAYKGPVEEVKRRKRK